jgi:hypothetical protein
MTADTHSEELKRAVERMHGGTASFIESVPVKETFAGKTVWEGVVHVFELGGNSLATRAYAWLTAEEGSESRSIAVLHVRQSTRRRKQCEPLSCMATDSAKRSKPGIGFKLGHYRRRRQRAS